jgi:2-polyprenyl-3-methyl-5-hydroxy-6-metoxy-1,4-benzoquinol methylase
MIGRETLDDPRAAPAAVRRTLGDIARLNSLFGGTRAVVGALTPFFQRACNVQRGTCDVQWTLLDVGAGSGDIARAAAAAARGQGLTLRPVAVELSRAAAREAQGRGLAVILADGGALPVRPRSVDVIVASQVLHHQPREVAVRWMASFDRIARRAVVLADLRRSPVAMVGVWLASFPLGMAATTRHDAVVSLRRGYKLKEFRAMLREAGVPAVPRYRPGFRIVAAWSPRGSRQ